MSEDSNGGEVLEVSLKSLRLRPGLFLKIQPRREGAAPVDAQFIAAIEGKGVMLTPSGMDSHKTEINVGDEYLIQGFTGQSDFSFTAAVVNVFKAPFAHALFAYPAAVKAKKVRKTMRMKTALPASISPCGQNTELEVSILDLSEAGAMISCSRSLGVIGSFFDLAFPVRFEDEHANLNIVARLCHTTFGDNGERRIGLSFENVSRENKLLLNYFVGRMREENSFIIEP